MPKKLHPSLQKLFASLPIAVIFYREEDGSFWGKSAELEGCYAQGKNLLKAMEEFKYAVFLYFEVPKKYADPQLLKYTAPIPAELVDTITSVENPDPHLDLISQTLQPQHTYA